MAEISNCFTKLAPSGGYRIQMGFPPMNRFSKLTSPDAVYLRCLLAVISGALYSQAFPTLGWRWLVVPGLAGLLLALHGLSGTRARAVGFFHGMAVYGCGLVWLFQIFGWLVVVLWCVLASFTAMFAHMQGRAFVRGWTGWKWAAFTAVNWCGWEFIRAELFPLKFPWMTAGLAVGPNAWLPWIGVYGAGALVMFGIAVLFLGRWKLLWVPLALGAMGFLLLPRIAVPSLSDPLAVRVTGLQFENVSFDTFIARTRELQETADHVVWPEYAVPHLRSNAREMAEVQALCAERGMTLTLGTTHWDTDDIWRNIALTMDADGEKGEHTKNHTVHLFADGLAGKTAVPVATKHGKVGTPICFDFDYEGVARKMTRAGAEYFVVPTMDAMSWTARQHDQHAELARIRACENGRWAFVTATSGVSQLIDPAGRVHKRLAAMEQGSLSGVLKRGTKLTFYTRYGWLFPWCALGLAAVCWLALVFPVKRTTAPAAES